MNFVWSYALGSKSLSLTLDVQVLDESRLGIVPVITDPYVNLFEILRFLVHFGLQQLFVHVHSVYVLMTFEGLSQSEVHPLVHCKFWAPEVPVATTINCIGNSHFLTQGEQSRNSFSPSRVSTCSHVQDVGPSTDPSRWFEVNRNFVLFRKYWDGRDQGVPCYCRFIREEGEGYSFHRKVWKKGIIVFHFSPGKG